MSKIIFNTNWFEMHEIVNEKSKNEIFHGIKPPDYVTCVAFDENNRIILISQYRPIIGRNSLETPGGQVDKNQSPDEAIRNELIEEIGYEYNSIEKILTLDPDVGRLMNKLHIYKANKVKNILSSNEEGIEIKKFEIAQIKPLIESGELKSAFSILAISLVVKNIL